MGNMPSNTPAIAWCDIDGAGFSARAVAGCGAGAQRVLRTDLADGGRAPGADGAVMSIEWLFTLSVHQPPYV